MKKTYETPTVEKRQRLGNIAAAGNGNGYDNGNGAPTVTAPVS